MFGYKALLPLKSPELLQLFAAMSIMTDARSARSIVEQERFSETLKMEYFKTFLKDAEEIYEKSGFDTLL